MSQDIKVGDLVMPAAGETLERFGFYPDKSYEVTSVFDSYERPHLRVKNWNGAEHAFYASRFRFYKSGSSLPEVAPSDTKPSNPKAAVGASKLALNFVPASAKAYLSSAFYEGASKYGGHNWRVAGVQASTYKAACERHIDKWWDGQDHDPKTKVHHLANAMACLAIILDAEVAGLLTDDRPPCVDLEGLHETLAKTQAHLTQLHAEMKPVHCFAKKDLKL